MSTELVIKMNDDNVQNGFESKEKALDPATGNAGARRRLLKRGASAVVITMASRPVLAWHCKSPSVVASEALNPNTSLAKKNASTRVWADETWGLREWKANKVRRDNKNGVQEWWEITQPWRAFMGRVGSATSKTFDQLTASDLFQIAGIVVPSDVGSSTIVAYLNNSANAGKWHLRVVVAQLNLFTLVGRDDLAKNDLDNCVTMSQLNEMATGSFQVGGQSWSSSTISSYLYNNWMAR